MAATMEPRGTCAWPLPSLDLEPLLAFWVCHSIWNQNLTGQG